MRFAVAAPASLARLSLPLAALLTTILATVPVAAQSCAVAYRQALDGVRDKRADALSSVVRTMRAADPQLSGKWLFSAALFDPARKPKTERVCAETTTLRSGRSKCGRFETRTIPRPGEPAITSPTTADELKDLKALAPFVEAMGAVPELGPNGRFGFLFQRLAQDLRAYLTQEPHPALCAGGTDLTEFYDAQFAPLRRRQSETADLAKRTRAAAIARVRAIATAEAAVGEKAASTAAPPAMPADIEGKSLVNLIAAAVRPLASDDEGRSIAAAASPLQALATARASVLASQTATPPSSVDPAVRDAAGHALRILEAAIYADLVRARYVEVEAALFTANADIRAAHKATCTCAD